MKTNTEELTQLIYNAPIGQYIGENGARILAEKAALFALDVAIERSKIFNFAQDNLRNNV